VVSINFALFYVDLTTTQKRQCISNDNGKRIYTLKKIIAFGAVTRPPHPARFSLNEARSLPFALKATLLLMNSTQSE